MFHALLVRVSVSIALFGLPAWVNADELDAASSEALRKTQQLLTTPDAREKAIFDSKSAQLVDDQVRSLVGAGVDREALYAISSQIFSDLVQASNGDVSVMAELLQKAKDDPKAFFNSLSAKNVKAIQELSKKAASAPSMSRVPASSSH